MNIPILNWVSSSLTRATLSAQIAVRVHPHITHCNTYIATANPRWCSIQNGVFLCTRCARKHKLFSPSVSSIRSLEIDLFSKDDLTLLRLGGNARFNGLMHEYNIPLTADNQKYKYHTVIADYHRKCLHEEVLNGGCLLDKPDLRAGIALIADTAQQPPQQQQQRLPVNTSTVTPLYDPNLFSSASLNVERGDDQRKEEVNFNEEFKNVASSLGKIFGKLGSGISSKMKEIGLDDTLASAGDSAKQFLMTSKEFISDKGKAVAESELFQNVKQKAESGFDYLHEKANELIEQGNQQTNRGNGSNHININIDTPNTQ